MEAVIPKAAASLILLKGDRTNPQVLLGRRKASLRFMPGYYVYPGGRIDPTDYEESAALNTSNVKKITGITENLSAPRAAAHIFGVHRELWEETGLLLGQKSSSPVEGLSPLCQAYNNRGLTPLMTNCHCVAQAITPEGSPVRFNTYFFIANGQNTFEDSEPSGELEDINWYFAEEALKNLQIADVTEAVLKEALTYWQSRDMAENKEVPVPLLTYPAFELVLQR